MRFFEKNREDVSAHDIWNTDDMNVHNNWSISIKACVTP